MNLGPVMIDGRWGVNEENVRKGGIMDLTADEVAYVRVLFTEYQDILNATQAVLQTSSNPLIISLASDTLSDMGEEIDELNNFFAMLGVEAQDDAESPEEDATEVADSPWSGAFSPSF